MAIFVHLGEDDREPPQHCRHSLTKAEWDGLAVPPPLQMERPNRHGSESPEPDVSSFLTTDREEATHELAAQRAQAQAHSMTLALGCYPIVMAVATQLDLNDLDSLSRTCRPVHDTLLQNRSILLKSTMHCVNEDLPVDPDSTLRYRARAGNWYYMEDTARDSHCSAKAGTCARDLVSSCRKCSTIVCRNCAIKPPAPAVMRERHRRLCVSCQKIPVGHLVKPRQAGGIPLPSDSMIRAICTCETVGVWLCQSCGRGIRGADSEYRSIWKWRAQYGEVLGGLGTGIGDADRGVECWRKAECCSSRYIEYETDCDAEDGRQAEDLVVRGHSASGVMPSTLSRYNGHHSWSSSHRNLDIHGKASTPKIPENGTGSNTRTPSPALGPGYARHEVEGIGNKIKSVRITMVRVGACVPDWKDERVSNLSLRREMDGQVRSWCGWCCRLIPARKDYEAEEKKRLGPKPACAASA